MKNNQLLFAGLGALSIGLGVIQPPAYPSWLPDSDMQPQPIADPVLFYGAGALLLLISFSMRKKG